MVRELGYKEPTPVQAQAIPLVLEGRDLMAGAQTGTGKTAAFALPILQQLAPLASSSASPARHPVRALLLTPTRELAIQVEASFREYAKHLPLRTAVVYGGVDMNAQIAQLRQGVEVLVATPGRLLDHVQNRTVTFGQVSVLTLDEADRMLDMGFLPDIRRILALLPARRQNLLFSATFPQEIRKLAATLLNNPAEVQIAARNAVAELVTHVVHPVAREKKRELLCHLVRTRKLTQVLVFSATRIGANRLAHQLRREHIHADAIHGDKSQSERLLALEGFKAGQTTVLVATDVASRGLDIEGLPQVINFDIPHSPEDYVHRIGRTGRAGLSGEAISLVASEDREALAAIEKLIKLSIERVIVPGFEPDAGAVAAVIGREHGRGERAGGRGRGDGRGGRGDSREPGAARGPAARGSAARGPAARGPAARGPAAGGPAAGGPAARGPAATGPAAARPAANSDPIFSAPYEPGEGQATEQRSPAERSSARRPKQVAALLGGLRPAKG